VPASISPPSAAKHAFRKAGVVHEAAELRRRERRLFGRWRRGACVHRQWPRLTRRNSRAT
jgi:hypothetical protein